GEIDVAADGLRRALEDGIAAGARRLAVDLSRLTFLSTPAIDAVLAAFGRLAETGGQLAVVAGTDEIRRIFTITMLDRLFPVFAAQDEALAELGVDETEAAVLQRANG
nr:STAS domain-containing protein [Actinomycetota bacterium]